MFGRARALVGLAVARVAGRLRIAPQRVLLSLLGVALAIGLMVAVSGVSLGLASESVIESEGVDYWVVPEQSNVESIAVSAGGLQLGDVHATSAEIARDDRVDYATPVLLELVPVRDRGTGERTYVLAAGIVPEAGAEVLGLSASSLEPGDPYYANGSYGGRFTGEVVLNDAAASVTNASAGESLSLARERNRTLSVTNVSTGGGQTAGGTVPVMVMHLSELQSLTGATGGDSADQLLVSTNDRSVRASLAGRYPGTTVVTRSGISAQQVSSSNLPLAVAVAAFVSAVVVGVLFVTTLMGLEVSADRRQLGALAAIGYSNRSRSLLVASETVLITMIGGVVGIGVGLLGIAGVNRLGLAVFGVDAVAVFEPFLAGYALLVTLLIGLVGAAYPVLLSRRTDVLEVLS
ncbi:ABC transporter permease [Haloarcula onubensis]|uniref:ABC transporter permease n=1 Tax=Haloarcula onubensis TaxID=2950539 RepID=A0ABU2FJ62_9EURY|nr:ABC transporter permease [Halomicroarcula sp. S3CR25-11]MDS0280794.1 ABC transporter permease [Halomicroarcula sp. S3CR25-11]